MVGAAQMKPLLSRTPHTGSCLFSTDEPGQAHRVPEVELVWFPLSRSLLLHSTRSYHYPQNPLFQAVIASPASEALIWPPPHVCELTGWCESFQLRQAQESVCGWQ